MEEFKSGFVSIIGRTNVGKSTFFNYIVGKRISIVEDTPGVTRDRIYGKVTYNEKTFEKIKENEVISIERMVELKYFFLLQFIIMS